MSDDFETRIRTSIQAIELPSAPDSLWSDRRDVERMPRRRPDAPVVGLAGVICAVVVLAFLVMRPAGSTIPNQAGSSASSGGVAAAAVMTVGDVLKGRAAGTIKGEQVVMTGFWSALAMVHSCRVPEEPMGELESLACHEGEFGITEQNEPILVVDSSVGTFRAASGPHLSPWFPRKFAEVLFPAGSVGRTQDVPIPVKLLGHFDDPRAESCRVVAREACANRFVVDDVLAFGQ